MKESEIKKELSKLKGWRLTKNPVGQLICKSFVFDDFLGAIEFVNKIAEIAEKQNHHPDIKCHYVTIN